MRLISTDIEATYAVTRPFRLPFHRGGMLHGLFGRALRKVGCAEASASAGESPCAGSCARAGRCDWSRLFDPPRVEPPPHRVLSGAGDPPGPIVLLSPAPGAQQLRTGDEWRVALRLFGEGRHADIRRLERTLAAVADIPIGAEEGRVELTAVTRFTPREHVVEPAAAADGTNRRLTVHFETPVRLKQNGRAAAPADIDFGALFDHVWRRLTMICALYGEYGPEDDAAFRRLREAAIAVTTVERRLRELRWDHLSMETGVRKPLYGLIGHLVFEGELGPFWPALAGAEVVHIGGVTSFGLGRVRVQQGPIPKKRRRILEAISSRRAWSTGVDADRADVVARALSGG